MGSSQVNESRLQVRGKQRHLNTPWWPGELLLELDLHAWWNAPTPGNEISSLHAATLRATPQKDPLTCAVVGPIRVAERGVPPRQSPKNGCVGVSGTIGQAFGRGK